MDDQRKEAKKLRWLAFTYTIYRYSLLNPATFSSSLTRSLKQGTLKGHGKTAFPIRNRWLSEGVQIKAVTNEAVAGDSCIAVQSSMTMTLVTNTFESFLYAYHSHDGLFFLRAKTRRKEACFKGGG